MSRLARLKMDSGEWDASEGVFHVRDPHALTQAAGYLKYVSRATGPVFFRGQDKLYPTLYPSLHRGITSTSGLKNREKSFSAFLKGAQTSGSFINGTAEYAHAPILQHYGIRTKWLDLVDNIWIALWFACHIAKVLDPHARYLHFERRKRPYPDTGTPAYAYILLVGAGVVDPVEDCPGLSTGTQAEVIDLRVAAPSVYLRPHAQHGILLRRRNADDYTSYNMQPLILGVIRVEIGDALNWLGAGDLLSIHTLFPPPHYDYGYRQLLTQIPTSELRLGSIHHVGA